MNFKSIFKTAASFIKCHDTAILSGIGVIATVGAVVAAVKATPKCMDILTKADEEGCTNVEKAKRVLPAAAPTVVLTGVSIAANLASHKISSDRISGLVSAYDIAQKIHEGYKAKVKEEVGEEKELDIQQKALNQQAISAKDMMNVPVATGHGNDLFYDSWSGRWFLSDVTYIRKVLNELNRDMMNQTFVSLNEFYQSIGLDTTECGEELGWLLDYGLIDISFDAGLNDLEKPFTVMNFIEKPVYRYCNRRW